MNPTISERILETLRTAEKPLSPKEIAHRLGLRPRRFIGFHWGKWNFAEAEEKGLIVWDAVAQGWKLATQEGET